MLLTIVHSPTAGGGTTYDLHMSDEQTAERPTHGEHAGHTGHASGGAHGGHGGGHSGSSEGPGHIVEGHRTHHFDPAWADRLVSEERHQRMPVDAILRAAGIAAGQVVVDLGAGPGFFTLPAARVVGEKGRVYAVDVQPSLLEVCRRRAAEAGLSWIETEHSEEAHVPLPDAAADRVFIAFVLHEADDQVALLREAARLLRPGGEVAIVELHKREGTPGPPLAHRIGEDEVAAIAAQVGLRVLPVQHQSDDHYLMRLGR